MSFVAVGGPALGISLLFDDYDKYVAASEADDLERFFGFLASPDEVYVYRFDFQSDRPLTQPSELARIVRAYAETHGYGLHVNGILIDAQGGNKYRVDVILTTNLFGPVPGSGITGAGRRPSSLAKAMANHSEISQGFRNAVVEPGIWLVLRGPVAQRDFWLRSSLLWNMDRGPTRAFQDLDNIWIGRATQRRQQMKKEAPPPLFGGKQPGAEPAAADESLWIGVAAVAAVAAYAWWKGVL